MTASKLAPKSATLLTLQEELPPEFVKIRTKLGCSWEDRTLKEVEIFHLEFCKRALIAPYVAYFISGEWSCIVLTWGVAETAVSAILQVLDEASMVTFDLKAVDCDAAVTTLDLPSPDQVTSEPKMSEELEEVTTFTEQHDYTSSMHSPIMHLTGEKTTCVERTPYPESNKQSGNKTLQLFSFDNEEEQELSGNGEGKSCHPSYPQTSDSPTHPSHIQTGNYPSQPSPPLTGDSPIHSSHHQPSDSPTQPSHPQTSHTQLGYHQTSGSHIPPDNPKTQDNLAQPSPLSTQDSPAHPSHLNSDSHTVTCHFNTGDSTNLHDASQKGHLDVVKYLVEESMVDPSCQDEDGVTPLHLATENGHLQVVKYLTQEKKCDPEIRNKDNDTPLHLAALYGQLAVVEIFIRQLNCDPMCRDQLDRTPLHHASQKGHLDVVKYLVEGGRRILHVKMRIVSLHFTWLQREGTSR